MELKRINYDYLTTGGELVNTSSSTLDRYHQHNVQNNDGHRRLLLLAEGESRTALAAGPAGRPAAAQRRAGQRGGDGDGERRMRKI